MKKITFLTAFLLLMAWGGYSQCIRTAMYPGSVVTSNNLGFPQTIMGPYSSEYSQVSNIVVGLDYIFTCTHNTSGIAKYITVTDLANTVIAHGPSPLTVQAIGETGIKLHYSENAACASGPGAHTVTITAVLNCGPVVNYSVSDITTTAATFTWTPQGEETAWQVLVVPNGTTAPTSTTTGTDVTTNPTYTDLTLTAATKYQFYIRGNCGDEFSPWNGPLNFTSACVQVTSITENFDAIAYGQLPVCWAQVKNGTGSSQYSSAQVVDFNFNSPSRAARVYSENTSAEANIILVAPEVSNLSAGTHRVKFFAKSSSPTGSMQVGTVDNTTADAVFTEVETIALTSTYEEYSVDFTDYTGTDNFLAFRHNNATLYTGTYIDDVRWEVAPLCADVSQVTVPGATITAAEATINWTSNGDETEWDVVYGATTVTDPTTLTPITPAPTGTPEATLTGLTDNTSYKVWVRSVCGENNGAWVGPKTFKTACVAATTINETFDTYAYGTVPNCWSAVKSGTGISQYAYAHVTDYNFFSPSRTAQLSNDNSPATANIMLVAPQLSNIAAGTHRVKFYAKSSGTTGNLQVGTVNSNGSDAVFTEVQAIPLTSTHTQYVVEFTATDVTDTYLAFRFNTTGSYNSIFFDNVIWEPIPLCADVTAITVPATTPSGATVNWTPGGAETQWDVVYGATTVTDPSTLTPISPAPTTAEATLTGLTDNTSYKVWVRSVCGAENGAWIGPITFKTQCLSITSFDENFDTSAYNTLPQCWSAVKNGAGIVPGAAVFVIDYNYYSAARAMYLYNGNSPATANVVLVSPNLSNVAAGTHRVKFFAKCGSGTGNVQVGTVDGTGPDAVFTEVQAVALTSTYTEYAVNFTDYTGTDTNIAFRHNNGTTYSYVYLDNVRWEIAPLCADVANVAVSDVTTETASVAWESQGNETNWQVAYGPATTTDPTTLTPSDLLTVTNFPISGLTDNTSYKVWVRSACGATNGNGMWMGPIQFTTQCLATTVPFTQDFETAVTPALPTCTTLQNLSTANNFITNTLSNYGFSSKVLQYSYNCSVTAAANAWYFTKGLTLTGGTEYKISYKYGGNTTPGGSYVEKLKVMYGTGAQADSMTEDLDDHTFTTNMAATNEVTFTPETSGVYYFGFNAYSNACQNNIYIDDITIEEVLGTNDFNGSEFKFYPNPVKDVLNLSYAQNISDVVVYNLLGQKVIENTINANAATIDMSALSSGSYIVKVTSENQTKTIKVIKE